MNEEEKIKDLKAVYSGAVQAGEIGIANMIKGGIDLIEKLQKENELAKKQVEYDKTHICTPQIIKLNYIPIQKVKDKIEEIKQEKKKYGNCLIEMYEDELVNRDIKILQELIEEREEK